MSKSVSKKSEVAKNMNMEEVKKSVQKKEVKSKKEEVVVPEEVKEVAPKKRASKKEAPEPVHEEVEAESPDLEEKKSKKRREVNAESVDAEFLSIMEFVKATVEEARSSTDKKKGVNVKALNQVAKRLKVLKDDVSKLGKTKTRKRTNPSGNASSGFMKPVKVSDEMAKFAKWDPSQLRSRIDATRYICQYIKDHDLQNPEDRRQIKPDRDLSRLLDLDPKDPSPLTYYNIQKKIQRHFTNPDN